MYFKLEAIETKAEETPNEKVNPTKSELRDGNFPFSSLMIIQTIQPWQTMEAWSSNQMSRDWGVN